MYGKHLEGLIPPEFDLKQYDSLSKCNAYEWVRVLQPRFELLKFIEESDMKGENLADAIAVNIKHILSGADFGIEYSIDYKSISSFGMDANHDEIELNHCKAIVDLSFPDNLLLEDFKNWVTEQRVIQQVKSMEKTFSVAALRRWHDSRVLPYIDLCHWQLLNKIKVTDGQFGEILFPNDNRGGRAERVRKTTRKLALEMVKPKFYLTLMAQAEHCQRKENS